MEDNTCLLYTSMDAPTSGIYRLDGEHMERASEKRLSAIRGQKISFVFQHFALLEDCTAAEKVALPLLRQRKMCIRDSVSCVMFGCPHCHRPFAFIIALPAPKGKRWAAPVVEQPGEACYNRSQMRTGQGGNEDGVPLR